MQPPPRRSRVRFTIIIVSVIVVLIVLGAALCSYWMRFHGSGRLFPSIMLSKAPVEGGWQINIVGVDLPDYPWDDIRVQVNEWPSYSVQEWAPVHSVGWNIKTADLDGGANITAPYAAKLLGTLSVTLTVTDIDGDGVVSSSDYFTITADPAFSSTTGYSMSLLYPHDGFELREITFSGV